MYDLVLVELEKVPEATTSGLIVPEYLLKSVSGAERGTVVAVGSGRVKNGTHIPVEVKVGDVVLFARALDFGDEDEWVPMPPVDGMACAKLRRKRVLVPEQDILAIVDPGAPINFTNELLGEPCP